MWRRECAKSSRCPQQWRCARSNVLLPSVDCLEARPNLTFPVFDGDGEAGTRPVARAHALPTTATS